MEKPFIIKTTNNVNVAKFTTFIIGINFILGRFYELTYLYTIGVDTRKIDSSLLDYIRTGLDLLPITILFVFYSLFSIKPGEASKLIEHNSAIKKLHESPIIRKICDLWIPEILMMGIFLAYSFSIYKSVPFLILLFMTPFLIYLLYKKKIEKIIKARISYAHSLIIKFVLVLISLFMIMGWIDGRADCMKCEENQKIVSLRNANSITMSKRFYDDKTHVFTGYVLKAFDKITIFKIEDKIVIINNWEILSIREDNNI